MTEIPTPAPRRRMLKGARLVFNNGHSVVSAVLRDMSETGARVTVENGLALPEHISLVLDEGGSYQCVIVRRELKELGLQFIA